MKIDSKLRIPLKYMKPTSEYFKEALLLRAEEITREDEKSKKLSKEELHKFKKYYQEKRKKLKNKPHLLKEILKKDYLVPEREIEEEVCNYAQLKGWTTFKLSSPPGNPGMPDRLLYKKNKELVYIEFKRKKGQLSKMQKKQIAKLKERGDTVEIINDTAAGKAFIDSISV